jgi:restriction system protein
MSDDPKKEPSVPPGIVAGAGAVTVAGEIRAAPGVLPGAAAFSAAGEFRAAPGGTLSGAAAFSAAGEFVTRVETVTRIVNLLLQTVIIPGVQTDEGRLIEAVAVPWFDIIALLQKDPRIAYQLAWEKWEEIIAGAYKKAGFDEVTLTPRSGDYGRDVIAIKKGLGTVRVIDQVKAYKPPHLVTGEEVSALIGVLQGDGASKGFLTTTSDLLR